MFGECTRSTPGMISLVHLGNVSVSSGSVGGMRVTDEGSLQIAKAGPSHHGTYTCVASNRVAAITTSAVLSVKGNIFTL